MYFMLISLGRWPKKNSFLCIVKYCAFAGYRSLVRAFDEFSRKEDELGGVFPFYGL